MGSGIARGPRGASDGSDGQRRSAGLHEGRHAGELRRLERQQHHRMAVGATGTVDHRGQVRNGAAKILLRKPATTHSKRCDHKPRLRRCGRRRVLHALAVADADLLRLRPQWWCDDPVGRALHARLSPGICRHRQDQGQRDGQVGPERRELRGPQDLQRFYHGHGPRPGERAPRAGLRTEVHPIQSRVPLREVHGHHRARPGVHVRMYLHRQFLRLLQDADRRRRSRGQQNWHQRRGVRQRRVEEPQGPPMQDVPLAVVQPRRSGDGGERSQLRGHRMH